MDARPGSQDPGNPERRFRLDGKVVVITGASAGLGAAAATGLARAGARLALGARREDCLRATEEAVRAVGGQTCSLATDVTEPGQCQALAEHAMSQFGQVDVLLNCAGLGWSAPATRERPEDFRRVVDVNLMGSYWMAQACGRVMGRGSSVVNVGSALGQTTAGLPQAAYSSSKAALIGLTRDLAQQWSGRKGIRVNLLVLGLFPSEMSDLYERSYVADIIDRRVPMGRMGTLDEWVSAALFLASSASSYVTGSTLSVDGGFLTT